MGGGPSKAPSREYIGTWKMETDGPEVIELTIRPDGTFTYFTATTFPNFHRVEGTFNRVEQTNTGIVLSSTSLCPCARRRAFDLDAPYEEAGADGMFMFVDGQKFRYKGSPKARRGGGGGGGSGGSGGGGGGGGERGVELEDAHVSVVRTGRGGSGQGDTDAGGGGGGKGGRGREARIGTRVLRPNIANADLPSPFKG